MTLTPTRPRLRSMSSILTEIQGKIMTCVMVRQMTHEQTAEALQIPRRTVTYHFNVALARLRDAHSQGGLVLDLPRE